MGIWKTVAMGTPPQHAQQRQQGEEIGLHPAGVPGANAPALALPNAVGSLAISGLASMTLVPKALQCGRGNGCKHGHGVEGCSATV